jgi:hypothetical protein
MNKWVLCGLCVFMLTIILFSSCSCKENMSNMNDEYIVMTVLEMKKTKKFDLEQYIGEYLKLHKETVKKMILRLEDTLFFDILEKKTGVSDIKTITELRDNLQRIHGKMK